MKKYIALATLYTLPLFAAADQAPCPPNGTTLCNPVKAESLTQLFGDVLSNVIIPVSTVIAVMFIIWAGLKFVLAQGKAGEIEKARQNLIYVLIGVALVIGAQVILDLLLNTVTQITNVTPS